MTRRSPRIYLAGPMTGVGGNFNFPLFDHVANRLRKIGFEVFSPADYAREKLGPLETIQKMDKQWLNQARGRLLKDEINWIFDNADLLLLLPGWQRSTGATAERAVALAMNIPVQEMPNIILYDSSVDAFKNPWDFVSEYLQLKDLREHGQRA